MSLMERVSTLIRANLNDLLERAEDPGKLARQLALDMENQLVQVKTQLAIALADQHVLAAKLKEADEKIASWRRKAELALGKGDEELARVALERSVVAERVAAETRSQLEDVRAEGEELKGALGELKHKVEEVRAKSELLVARQRRARAKVNGRKGATMTPEQELSRMESKVRRTEALGRAGQAVDDVEGRLERLEMDDRVERLLTELRERKKLPAASQEGR